MTLAPPAPAAPQAPASGLERLVLPPGLKLSAEQFALVCEANPEAVLELTAAGQVIAMTPTGGDTSARNNLLSARLQVWALGQGGWKVFDSPVASASPMAPCSAPMRPCCGFPPLCPELVVELVSPSVAAGFSEGVEGHRGSEALRR